LLSQQCTLEGFLMNYCNVGTRASSDRDDHWPRVAGLRISRRLTAGMMESLVLRVSAARRGRPAAGKVDRETQPLRIHLPRRRVKPR